LPEATNVGGKSIFWAQTWLREVALNPAFRLQSRYSFQSIFEALSIEIRRPRGLAAKFLERLDKAIPAAAARSEDNNN
jgi:hypothetical protein